MAIKNKALTLGVATAFAAASLLSQGVAMAQTESQFSESTKAGAGFEECQSGGYAGDRAKETSLGEGTGPGKSEELSSDELKQANEGLAKAGRGTLPDSTVALRYYDDGTTGAIDKNGNVIQKLNDTDNVSSDGAGAVTTYSVHDEIKSVVGACLGVGAGGGTTWKALGEDVLIQLTSWRTAVKFVIRRIGLMAAVSCMGGIVWHYV
ncbi:hypothetical protein [Corynebacterium striatum]|uniref:hypothetical protein n=1 Tax=Corynebacterium striatum TaxID=43770 RepID=UPI003B5AF2C5